MASSEHEQEGIVTTAETVHIVVGWNEDYDGSFAYADSLGVAEDTAHLFEFDVPKPLWDALTEARAAERAAYEAVIATTTYDEEVGRLKEPCPSWRGDVRPDHHWWAVGLSSVSEDEWPVRDTRLRYCSSEAEAQAFIDALPDDWWWHEAGGLMPVRLTKDRLSVQEGGYKGGPGECNRCGWERDKHADPGVENEPED